MGLISTIKDNPVLVMTSSSAVILLVLFILVPSVFLLAFAGVLLAIFIHGISHFLDQYIVKNYSVSFLVTFLGLMLLIGLFVWYLVPALQNQLTGLEEIRPEIMSSLDNLTTNYPWLLVVEQSLEDLNIEEFLRSSRGSIVSQITNIFSATTNFLFSALVIIFIGLYLAFNPSLYKKGFVSLFYPEARSKVKKELEELGTILRWWLLGRLASMATVALLTYFGLVFLEVPLALPLAFLTGLLSFIPNIGPIISFIPAGLVGLSVSLVSVLYILILFIVVQTIESYILTPMIQQKNVEIPPAILLLTQVLMGLLFGLIGLILAAPLVVVVMTLIKDFYLKKIEG